MRVFARGVGFAYPNGAIGGTPFNTVVHSCVFMFFAMFGTRDPNGLIGRWRCRHGG